MEAEPEQGQLQREVREHAGRHRTPAVAHDPQDRPTQLRDLGRQPARLAAEELVQCGADAGGDPFVGKHPDDRHHGERHRKEDQTRRTEHRRAVQDRHQRERDRDHPEFGDDVQQGRDGEEATERGPAETPAAHHREVQAGSGRAAEREHIRDGAAGQTQREAAALRQSWQGRGQDERMRPQPGDPDDREDHDRTGGNPAEDGADLAPGRTHRPRQQHNQGGGRHPAHD